MEQYISKSAVVAEIEKLRKNAWESFQKGNSTEDQYYIRCGVIQDILASIYTFEVKEVDLEKELDFVKDAYYYFTSDERSSMKKVAKHFFELGLKA